MDNQFAINWKRGSLAILAVGILTLAVSLGAKSLLMHDGASMSGDRHLHENPGPFFDNLFKIYVPRKVCMFHEPGVIWLHFISDFLIALSYFSIPVALVYFVRRRQGLSFSWIFWMFAAFIMLCGTTHLIGMLDLWFPLYKIDGIVKLITGVVSLITALMLWPLIPKALALPSPAQLEKRVNERTNELAEANTEIQMLLERERILRDQSETANLLKDQFLATLSHELRTPLNAIFGWVQLLKKKSPDKYISDGLDVIERNSRLQARLISDLLDMTSILSGKVRLENKEFDFKELFNNAIDSLLPTTETKKISVQREIEPQKILYYGDPTRLHQILWNLLSNAIKFTPEGGMITAKLRLSGENIEIIVADNGAGIKEGFLPHIFDRFSQADSSTTRKHGGLGLGLAVCKYLVELHGGTIRAASEGVNKGSQFTITLPPSRPFDLPSLASTQNKGKSPFKGSLRGSKILIVDDETDSLELTKEVLNAEGAITYTATNTNQAMEILKTEKPDLLLCDISMPEENGYSFIRRVRAMSPEEGRNILAIALTALANPEDQERSLDAGFETHIAKPFEHEVLIDKIIYLLQFKDENTLII